MKLKANGYILWTGASLIDGAPIAAIAIRKSRNIKTGNMVQTFIIRTDIHPLDALDNGADVSVCGDCKHRPMLGGSCYVNVGQSVSQVYSAFKRGSYPMADAAMMEAIGRGRKVRLGAYGDPAAIPANVWKQLTAAASGVTGYTHQWHKVSDAQKYDLQTMCMASADSAEEKTAAKADGWRTFRVRTSDEVTTAREIICPASDEAGNKVQCIQCMACGGKGARNTADVAIVVHGAKAARFIALKVQ